MGDVPHKSPGNKALVIPNSDTKKKRVAAFAFMVPRSLNLTFDNIFRDDVSVDSFVMSFGGEQEIVLQPVLIQKKTYSTKNWNTK